MEEHLNKINFLWQAAALFKPTSEVNKLLKSHFINTLRDVAKYEVNLPKSQFGESSMCSKCSTHWIDGNFDIKILQTRCKSNKANELVAKLIEGQVLTKKQKKRAKWYRKRITSLLELHCNFCHHKTNITLKKPIKEEQEFDNIEKVEVVSNKSKKKRKNDKSAGLKIQALKSDSIKKDQVKLKEKGASTSTDKRKNNSKSLLNTSKNIKKVKNSNPKNNMIKPISKTQQNNALLQLAAMLKSGNNKQSQTSNEKLKKLLR